MFHNSQAVLALSKEPNPTVFQKTLGLNDFYFGTRRDRLPARQHPDGRQVVGGDVPRREAAPDEARARADARGGRAARGRLLALDGGPAAAREPRDPAPRRPHRARVHADQRRAQEAAVRTSSRSCSARSGCTTATSSRGTRTSRTRSPSRACAHQAGTCRFGRDPATSVLNTDCRAHEVDNLYVVDTSFFPSIGAVNPALTAMANAVRVGDHLLERLGARRPGRRPPMPDADGAAPRGHRRRRLRRASDAPGGSPATTPSA